MRRRRWLLFVLAGAACALLVARGLAGIYTQYLWYSAMGASDVWRDKYVSLGTLRLLCGTLATLFVFVNLYAVRQSVVSLVLPRRVGNLEFGEEVPRTQLTWSAVILSAILGITLAWPQDDWSQLLAARIGQPFGESDPYFAADLGFFVYQLPFELSLFRWALTVALIVIGIVLLLYALTPSLRWEQGGLYVSGYVRRHMAMLAGTLLLLLAWHYRLTMFTALSAGGIGEEPFSYVDHRVGIPGSLLLALVTLGAGLTVLWGGWTGQMRLVFAALTGVLVVALGARQVAPFIASRTASEVESARRERPYDATRAGYTRRAFAVDRVATADSTLAFATFREAATQVPIWDDAVLRPATEGALPGTTAGWVASDTGIAALVPTRSGGGTLAIYLATAIEENATPVRSFGGESRLDVPPLRIFADSAPPAMAIADSAGELAAPALGSSLSRVAHALSHRDVRLWLGELPAPSPRLLSRRSVRERVRALAPFFVQGSTISPIWFGGSLLWTLDLYSASSTYPLSQHVSVAGGDRSYFQHAATAVVNAHTGRTTLVADSAHDAVTATWVRRFPALFSRPTALPLPLRRQLPPPMDGARAQASAFGRFGTRDEVAVERILPHDEGPDSALAGTPAPPVLLRDAQAIVLPLVDRTDRVRGLFLALGGTVRRSVWMPLPDTALAWHQALDRLRAMDTVQAATLVRGYVRVLPVGREVILAQPRYELRAGAPPRLRYVTALVGDSVHTGPSLLDLAGHRPLYAVPTDFRARVAELYDVMRQATARGDWAAFGRAFDELGALLARSRGRESP